MTTIVQDATTPLEDAFQRFPSQLLDQARGLRVLIQETAASEGINGLEETVKWGEPAFLPGKTGTTVRIGHDPVAGHLKLLVHCQTDLVERWRQRFGDRLRYEGNRAVLIPADRALDETALASCIAEAFTYRRKGRHG